ncbi:MAG: hypothetical protein D6795_15975 [Deltaproteobacteria bacterium]|nr:MAG: hypothetical protein D6795_15975 [Deltaproteobacteria bacterium]
MDFFVGGGLDLVIGSLGPIDVAFGVSLRSHFLLTQNGEVTLTAGASPQELGTFTHVTTAMAGLSLWLF